MAPIPIADGVEAQTSPLPSLWAGFGCQPAQDYWGRPAPLPGTSFDKGGEKPSFISYKVPPPLDSLEDLPILRNLAPTYNLSLKGYGIQPHQFMEEETGSESFPFLAKEDT